MLSGIGVSAFEIERDRVRGVAPGRIHRRGICNMHEKIRAADENTHADDLPARNAGEPLLD